MAKRARPKAHGTRFDQREIAIRVQKLRERKKVEPKALYDALGIGKGEYSRKERGITPWTLWEASKIADLLEAPPGWPFVTETEGELIRAKK